MATKKTHPHWQREVADGIAVTLSRPTQFNGVKCDTLTMRPPEVRDIRAANRQFPDDDEAREVVLFASLTQVAPEDIEKLLLKDYNRLQASYFRLLSDDENESGDAKKVGEAAGEGAALPAV